MNSHKANHILDFNDKIFQEVMKLFNVNLDEQTNLDKKMAYRRRP